MSKSQLNYYCQKSGFITASYATQKQGDVFVSVVTVNGTTYTSVNGHTTKKEAEADAARVSLQSIVQIHPTANSIEELLVITDREMGIRHKKYIPSPSGVGPLFESVSPKSLPLSTSMLQPQQQVMYPPLISSPDSIRPPMVVARPLMSAVYNMPPPYSHNLPLSGASELVPPSYTTPSHYGPGISDATRTRPIMDPPLPPCDIPPPPFSIPSPPRRHQTPCVPPYLPSRSVFPISPTYSGMTRSPFSVTSPAIDVMSTFESMSVCDNFVKKLEVYCELRKISPPKFTIIEKDKNFQAKVNVNGKDYFCSREFGGVEVVTENVALVALALIGLQATDKEITAARPPKGSSDKDRSDQKVLLRRPVFASTTTTTTTTETYPDISISKHPQFQPSVASPVPAFPAPHQPPPLQPPAFFFSKEKQSISSLPASHPQVKTSGSKPKEIFVEQSKMTSNYKLTLNAYCQKNGIPLPQYDCTYPEDAVGYISTITVQERVFTSPTHGTKRGAESAAAALALNSFGIAVESNENGSIERPSDQGSLDSTTSSINAAKRNVSYKNILQEHLQKSHITDLPRYETERTETGYISSVRVRVSPDKVEEYVGKTHANKRAAEQDSAMIACFELNIVS